MTATQVRAIRGATTVDEDTPEQIEARTAELLTEIMERNDLTEEQLISILFTATADVVSAFPATAARRTLRLSSVPLICAQEIPVPGSMAHCIRVMLHVETSAGRDAIRHVYLRGTEVLNDDLPR